jgi:hypothetical protein
MLRSEKKPVTVRRRIHRAGTVPGFLSFSLEEQIIPLVHLE